MTFWNSPNCTTVRGGEVDINRQTYYNVGFRQFDRILTPCAAGSPKLVWSFPKSPRVCHSHVGVLGTNLRWRCYVPSYSCRQQFSPKLRIKCLGHKHPTTTNYRETEQSSGAAIIARDWRFYTNLWQTYARIFRMNYIYFLITTP